MAAAKANAVEETAPRNTLDVRVSAANRFILEKIYEDFRKVSPYDPMIDHVRNFNMRSNS